MSGCFSFLPGVFRGSFRFPKSRLVLLDVYLVDGGQLFDLHPWIVLVIRWLVYMFRRVRSCCSRSITNYDGVRAGIPQSSTSGSYNSEGTKGYEHRGGEGRTRSWPSPSMGKNRTCRGHDSQDTWTVKQIVIHSQVLAYSA